MTWVYLIQRIDGWNPNRQHRFLEERDFRIKENDEAIKTIEEHWKVANLIQEGAVGEKKTSHYQTLTNQNLTEQWQVLQKQPIPPNPG
ncbi:hypothetical protein O181_011553 [Austropuccinia psidii MF-1]|uniref:Uncharacterized protein n=1 Tax=Austropuccinia psidii MF-1 TaxID=1389203 RepID=A0A9Q3BVI2_9BASI|nr:hypothetical protein [Austropuccinia psidii MF-1]